MLREQQAELADYAERFAGLRQQVLDQLAAWKQPVTYLEPAGAPGKPRRLASYQTAGEERLRRCGHCACPATRSPAGCSRWPCPCGWY